MKPVVLLIGRLPNGFGDVVRQFDHLPIQWPGAYDYEEAKR